MNIHTKNYTRHFILGMSAFVVVLILAIIATRVTTGYSNWDNVIMLLPVFPGIYTGLSLAGLMRTLDDLQHRIQLEECCFSLANTAFVALLIGLLQTSASGAINFVWIIPIMAGFWGLGLWFAQRKFQ